MHGVTQQYLNGTSQKVDKYEENNNKRVNVFEAVYCLAARKCFIYPQLQLCTVSLTEFNKSKLIHSNQAFWSSDA